jgi:hypothetical protein
MGEAKGGGCNLKKTAPGKHYFYATYNSPSFPGHDNVEDVGGIWNKGGYPSTVPEFQEEHAGAGMWSIG